MSDNSLGYVRVLKQLYSPILEAIKDENVKKYSQLLVQLFVALMERIMQDKCNNLLIIDVERHTKLFLNILCKLEEYYYDAPHDDEDKGWKYKVETTSNLVGLLNIPSLMKDFGPLCLFWEGGYQGEGILRDIKPLVKQGTHKPYFAKNLMTKYYIDQFLQYLLNVD